MWPVGDLVDVCRLCGGEECLPSTRLFCSSRSRPEEAAFLKETGPDFCKRWPN
jgi:hypothetical protein